MIFHLILKRKSTETKSEPCQLLECFVVIVVVGGGVGFMIEYHCIALVDLELTM